MTAIRLDQPQQEFIAAIQAVINADRALTEQELLITTSCELLVDGALGTDELTRKVNEIWAGANIAQERVEAALGTAVGAGLMVSTSAKSGMLWSLTPAGRAGAGGARAWTQDAYARTARQLQDLAAEDLRPITDAEANLWVDLLAQALSDGIREAYAAFVGDVALLTDGSITPKAFDRSRAFNALREADLGEGITEFLEAAVLAALDRADPFGNDLVNHIATGCVLLAFLAGCDRADMRKRLCDLAEEEFVLDTPALVLLTGARRDAESILRALKATQTAGGQVVVTEHTIEEFVELVDSVGAEHMPALTRALEEGLNARAYCTTVSLPALETWVAALYEERYPNWETLEKEAHSIKQRLDTLGVIVRPHGNHVPETVYACKNALDIELSERHSKRTARAVERDANTMSMVLRHRAKREYEDRLWPGSWIVTTDRHIGPAYRRVSMKDIIPITVTITQWAVLAVSCQPTATAKELAAVTAPLVRHQAALAIAARYPADVALEIAKVLAPSEGPVSTDLRLAQLVSAGVTSMDVVLDPETGLPAGTTPLGLAGEVLARRQKRMDAQRISQTAQAEGDRQRAEARAADAAQAATREKFARERAEIQLRESSDSVALLKEELAEAKRRREVERRLGRRKSLLTGILVTCAFTVAISLIIGLYVLGLSTLVTTLVIWKQGLAWTRDTNHSARGLLLGALTESLALIQIFVHW